MSVQLEDLKALDEFVNRHDSSYEYVFVKKNMDLYLVYNFLFHTINMTSQKWLDETEVDKPVWSHQLTIVGPHRLKTGRTCLLIILSGQNDTSSHRLVPVKFALMHYSLKTYSIVAVLSPVPVQPLTFYKHPFGWENITGLDIVAYSWWRFINDSSVPPDYLVHFPMVKNFRRQYRAYCGWSYGLKPFYDMNITQQLDDPRFSLLASHVDPLAYSERYTSVIKFIIILTGDEVFQPDNSHYYLEQLDNLTYLNIIPNADYRFQGENILVFPITVFQYNIANGYAFPNISLQTTMTNTTVSIYFKLDRRPKEVYCYHADTVDDTRRDFRMKIASGDSTQDNPVKWTKSKVERDKSGVYKTELGIPEKGWRGFFIQAISVRHTGLVQLTSTSDLHVIPDTFPCPDCNEDEDGCHGTLV